MGFNAKVEALLSCADAREQAGKAREESEGNSEETGLRWGHWLLNHVVDLTPLFLPLENQSKIKNQKCSSL